MHCQAQRGNLICQKHFYPKDKHATAAFLSGIKMLMAFLSEAHFHPFTMLCLLLRVVLNT